MEVIILRLNYFFVGIYREPQGPPYKTYTVVFWNRNFNLYKEQKLVVWIMKWKRVVGALLQSNA
jgi:hypothetical protein